jgi:hypothetical protein
MNHFTLTKLARYLIKIAAGQKRPLTRGAYLAKLHSKKYENLLQSLPPEEKNLNEPEKILEKLDKKIRMAKIKKGLLYGLPIAGVGGLATYLIRRARKKD